MSSIMSSNIIIWIYSNMVLSIDLYTFVRPLTHTKIFIRDLLLFPQIRKFLIIFRPSPQCYKHACNVITHVVTSFWPSSTFALPCRRFVGTLPTASLGVLGTCPDKPWFSAGIQWALWQRRPGAFLVSTLTSLGVSFVNTWPKRQRRNFVERHSQAMVWLGLLHLTTYVKNNPNN